MTLHVHTARITSRDPDRLDITRESATDDGLVFAPSWSILRPALDARQRAEEAMKGAHRDHPVGAMHREAAAKIEAEMWAVYAPLYLDEMRASYRANRRVWDALLARERVTLCSFHDLVRWPGHCHRLILGRDILPKLGAVYEGEVMG